MGFNEMKSTIAGKKVEVLVAKFLRWLHNTESYEIMDGYVKEKDLIILIDDVEVSFEIKLDGYDKPSQRIPIEHKQHDRAGNMARSGIKVCESDYFCVFCERERSLYVFKTLNLKASLALGRFEENKRCNTDTANNQTECYMVNIANLRRQYEEHGSNEDIECILDMSEYIELLEKEICF